MLMFRRAKDSLEFLLAHPGGPFFRNKDEGVWTIPKGLVHAGEELLVAALREFSEETGPGRTSRQLLHVARLLRDPERYVAAMGRSGYEGEVGNALWGVYQMIGKLSGRVYVLA